MRHSDWKLLYTLYRFKSITKAADSLYMTQPALTKRLKQIEDEFGVNIAQRSAKGLVFTAKGEYLAEYATRMLQEYRELEEAMKDHGENIFGTLHIGASGSMARFLLPNLLGQYKRDYPEVEFEVTSEFSYKISQRVNTRKDQIGFIRGEHANGCSKRLIRSQQACAVCWRPFTLEELPSLPRIDFYSDQQASARIDSWWFEHYSIPPKIAMTVQSGSTCCEMVRNGLGYAIFLSEDFINGKQGIYRIPLYDKKQTPVIRSDWMIYREESLQLDVVRSFVEFAKQYFKENFKTGEIKNDEENRSNDPCD